MWGCSQCRTEGTDPSFQAPSRAITSGLRTRFHPVKGACFLCASTAGWCRAPRLPVATACGRVCCRSQRDGTSAFPWQGEGEGQLLNQGTAHLGFARCPVWAARGLWRDLPRAGCSCQRGAWAAVSLPVQGWGGGRVAWGSFPRRPYVECRAGAGPMRAQRSRCSCSRPGTWAVARGEAAVAERGHLWGRTPVDRGLSLHLQLRLSTALSLMLTWLCLLPLPVSASLASLSLFLFPPFLLSVKSGLPWVK